MLKKQRDRSPNSRIRPAPTGPPTKSSAAHPQGDKLEKYAHFLEPQKAEELSAVRLKPSARGLPDKAPSASSMRPRCCWASVFWCWA